MSLLLSLLRQLLEYYGVPPEVVLQRCEICLYRIARMFRSHHPLNTFSEILFQQLRAISRSYLMSWSWETKKYGSTRSFVRRLGKIISLAPYPRAHIQLVRCLNSLDSMEHSIVSSVTPSLADVLWIPNGNGESSARFRFDEQAESVLLSAASSKRTAPKAIVENGNAIKKISALEEELSHLRAQIAAIISVHGARSYHSCSDTVNSSNTPWSTFPQSAMTSTPASISPCTTVIPPPPPLPDALPSQRDPHISTTELIKQRRAANKIKDVNGGARCQKAEGVPSMTDVLKDINKVKLRAIERSPGGTPLPKTKKVNRLQWDPAALIAKALKEKFAAHSSYDDSFDKENRSSDASPFSSPETPVIGHHILKPNTKQARIKAEEFKQVSATRARTPV
ncbi:mitochondrial fission regulator 2 isoform X2 [Sphaerodactylus townsendi]|uniref:mitochondrial fission regulator 2 isoform X2 n=1 Tax=Sphaerodactylus townsendi TaxID=933632 RepID=UPI0020272D6F|nr:mitochondrial fission regulator 2 isoform X2 [Sphaerodactylus townsendi]